MTKIDIFSGFLGAGKTTLIKKLLKEAYCGEKVVLIENEFGEIGIDGGFLKEAGVTITEMNSGCICCSLVGDFGEALKKVISDFSPDRILIEPSGVGKLSDVIKAVEDVCSDEVVLGTAIAVADANKCKIYMKNFGEFYNNQITNANGIVLSRTSNISGEKTEAVIKLLREHNKEAVIITTPWDELDGRAILDAINEGGSIEDHLSELEHELHEHHEHHHHDHDCGCHEHHEHHHHDHDCGCHEHHDHHHHDHDCDCHDHHHHHADEVFSNWGKETAKKYSEDEIKAILAELDTEKYGAILRAKGIVAGVDGRWIYFDYVPYEHNVRLGSADVIGKICVIGSDLCDDSIAKLFGLD